jgi:hypothetical protein
MIESNTLNGFSFQWSAGGDVSRILPLTAAAAISTSGLDYTHSTASWELKAGAGGGTLSGAWTVTSSMLFSIAPSIQNVSPLLYWYETDQAADEVIWRAGVIAKVFAIQTVTDVLGGARAAWQATRGTGSSIASITYGNAVDLPSHTFSGVVNALSPVFTGTITAAAATFSGDVTLTSSGEQFTLSSASPEMWIIETDQAVDEKAIRISYNTGVFGIRFYDDAHTGFSNVLVATRGTGKAVTVIAYGNTTDTPTHTFHGAMLFPATITPTAIAADTNDYAPTGFAGAYLLQLDNTAEWNITGIAGGTDGRTIVIQNIGAFNFILTGEDALSAAGSRFDIEGDYVLPPNGSVLLKYGTSRWLMPSIKQDISTTVLQPNASRSVVDNRVVVSYGWLKMISTFKMTISGNSKYVIL